MVEHRLDREHAEVIEKLVDSLDRSALFRNHVPQGLRESVRDVSLEERAALGLLVHELVPVLRRIFDHVRAFAVLDYVHDWPLTKDNV